MGTDFVALNKKEGDFTMEKLDKRTWKILKRIGVFVGTIIVLILLCKFAVYFMPFLIAGILAIVIEPIIKFCMNKLKMSRRVSSIIIVTLTIILFCLAVFYGGVALVRETINFTTSLSPTITNIIEQTKELISEIEIDNELISADVLTTIENSLVDFIGSLGKMIADLASSFLKYVLSLPTIIINIVITILALIFFTKDRIYVIDLMEYHLPKTWIKKITQVTSEFFTTLGGYIKVYTKIIIITFAELYLAFNIYNAIGFHVEYPFLFAVLIAIVDILPILGVGTILNPWALWLLVTGNYGYAIAVFITYVLIFIIRQFLEPKLVSKQFGIHPIITLFAMYAGFKSAGVFGLILGPIFLMILKCIFAPQLEKGLFKDIFDEK